MTDWVQYHNPAKNPPLDHETDDYGIYTRKPVGSVQLGDRVWVVTSAGDRPKQYQLAGWFDVAAVEANLPADDNVVSGTRGQFYRDGRRIDQEPWFAEFLRTQGNFGRGFSSIADRKIIDGLKYTARVRGAESRVRRRPAAR